ncbi:MAG: nitroreductase family protein, partial [Actinomycetota bacterium]|nr:nitroreductase family protein [Actinomycetota bacterium]
GHGWRATAREPPVDGVWGRSPHCVMSERSERGEESSDPIETIMTTRAMRRFSDQPVDPELIRRCLAAAQQAPSGGNVQPQQYVVLTEPRPKAEIGELYRRAFDRYEASLPARTFGDDAQRRSWERTSEASRHLADHLAEAPAIVLFLQPLIPWGGRDADGPLDIGRLDASVYPAVQNFCLAARSLGLGTALTTVIRVLGAEALGAVGVSPDRYEIAALVPVGWPTGRFGVAPRKPVEKSTHWNRWGNREVPGASEP